MHTWTSLKLILSTSNVAVLDLLGSIPLLQRLPAASIEELARVGQTRHFGNLFLFNFPFYFYKDCRIYSIMWQECWPE